MPDWSVVVPVYRERGIQSLVDHLVQVASGIPFRLIISASDGGWTARRILRPVSRMTVIEARQGRGYQISAGIALADTDRILVLHADTRLPPNAFGLMDKVLARWSAGAFLFCVKTRSPVLLFSTIVSNLRSLFTRIPFGDQAHFFRLEALAHTEGYPELPLFEDVAFMERLRSKGIPIGFTKAFVVTSDRRYRKKGYWRTTLLNWKLQMDWRRGVDAETLESRYRSRDATPGSQVQSDDDSSLLIIFHRAIVQGRVKTRIAARLGDEETVLLYRAFLEDIERTALASDCDVLPFVDSRNDERALFWPDAIEQSGANLGERMANAIQTGIDRGYRKILLIGSDLPHLSQTDIGLALAALSLQDTVFGPSSDGGYYLVGVNADRFDSRMFSLDAWSHDRVLADSLRKCESAGLTAGTIRTLTDFDELSDILEWYRLCRDGKSAPATQAACRKLF